MVRVHVVDRLAGVLFKVDAFDPDAARGAVAQFDAAPRPRPRIG